MSLYTTVSQLDAHAFCEKLDLFKNLSTSMGPGTEISFSHEFEKGILYVLIRNESQLHELVAMYSSVAYDEEPLRSCEPWRLFNLVEMLKEDILEREIVGFSRFNIGGAVFVTILTDDLEINPKAVQEN